MTAAPATFADVQDAAARIAGVAHRTPVLTSRTLNALVGAEVLLKCENLQRVGAFKFRGAYNAVAALTQEQRRRGVVAFSSGNHAQAIALAGRLQGAPVTVVMPQDAPAMKVEATRGYGADIMIYDRYTEDRAAIGRKLAEDRGLALIPPFDHRDVIAGQGTAALELFEEIGQADLLIAPLGGGGLLAGSCLSAAARAPRCAVIGVEPEAGDDGARSFRAGEPVEIQPPRSIADGALTVRLGEQTFPIISRLAADIVTVSDADLVRTMTFLAERLKIIVEPTGCLGLAALLAGKIEARGRRTTVILSGGNIDLDQFNSLIAGSRSRHAPG